jgi:hypothetical protein
MACFDRGPKRLFDYEEPTAEAHEIRARNISPYLVDAPDVLLENRSQPISTVPRMRFGSMPRDGGFLILSGPERRELLKDYPAAKPFVLRYTGAEEFLNGGERWCLWLVGVDPRDYRSIPPIMDRLAAVRTYRLASKAATTRAFGQTPGIFCQLAQPTGEYLLVPRVSSERRPFVPIGFASARVIANDQVLTVEGASMVHLGVLSSTMHMA